ncbi:fimbrial protein [Providencia sp. SKLX074055]|uniref:fimbrial protein n=1 Tax=Providencia xihuensis TaxID=3342830 RepID=UPI0035C01A11
MRKLIFQSILAASCVYLYSGYATAACTQNPNLNNIRANVATQTPINVMFDNLSTNETLRTITIPFSTPGVNTFAPNATGCGTSYLRGTYLAGWSPNANKIAPTNIDGIGIRVATVAIGDLNTVFGPTTTGGWALMTNNWYISVVKTKQVTQSGYIKSGNVANLTQTNTAPSNSTWYLSTLVIPANSIYINVLSCSLKSPVPTINLGDWYDTQFPSVGSTSTEVDIPITLTCMAGTNIKATVTATSGTVNAAQGQLALSGGADKATGVAIQIIDANKNHIPLNSKRTIKDNVAAGDYIFGWKARYIKTADKITPGPANGTATINIRYE